MLELPGGWTGLDNLSERRERGRFESLNLNFERGTDIHDNALQPDPARRPKTAL
jgi:hypothetical protein